MSKREESRAERIVAWWKRWRPAAEVGEQILRMGVTLAVDLYAMWPRDDEDEPH